jgi:hypothetical protein
MPRTSAERLAHLTGAQIDALLALPESELRAALQRLHAETQREVNRRREWRDRQAQIRAAMRAQDALDAAHAERNYTLIEQLLGRAVQGDDGSEA